MRAAILAVGTELLGTDRLDTNSLRLTESLERHGFDLVTKAVIGDGEAAIAGELERLLEMADVVLVSGGLGPTADDVTREAAAHALGRELVHDAEVLAELEAKFRAYGMDMPAVNRKQADVIAGAELIENRRGTAPGQRAEAPGGATLFLFPGVPVELEAMVETALEPWLAERSGGRGRQRGMLKIASLPESTVEERIAPAYGEFGREAISVLAKPGEVRIQFWASGGDDERRERLEAIARRLRELVGGAVFTDDPEADLAGVVGRLLAERGETVATAESCTGGWLGQRITSIAGSSAWYPGGVVCYSNPLKERLVGVPTELLAEHGAVSREVAHALAAGARERIGATYGLGITGVAGPGGGSEDKPVGTVHLALASPAAGAGEGSTSLDHSTALNHRSVRFPGDRDRVRWMSTQLALEMLRRHLLGIDAAPEAATGAEAGVA